MRIAFGVEYVGTNYSGWQSQVNSPEVPAIQTAVENAIAAVAAHPISITCAGRTDAGVHASCQIVHCDVQVTRTPRAWVFGCNTNLPPDIRILWMCEVGEDFSARKTAIGRHYKYIIYNHQIRPSLLRDYVGWYYSPLDAEIMCSAAQSWIGEHDFSSFRGAGCQSVSPMRKVKMINVSRRAELVIIDIIADAFLYHMVRNMVGVLLEIGSGRRAKEWSAEVLQARCRTKAGITAEPNGLYLTEVLYPANIELPKTNNDLWFINQS